MNPRRPAPPLSQISSARLLALLVLFAAACAYTVFHSDRFERESRALAVRLAESALERKISFQAMSVSFLPPSLSLTRVRIAGGPRDKDSFFAADELTASGAIRLVGRTLSIGTVRAVHPSVHIHVYRDGSDNLPPGLKRSGSAAAIKLQIGHVVAAGGEFIFNETRVPLDLELHSLLAEMSRVGPGDHYRGRLGCRLSRLALAGAEPFPFEVNAAFDFGRGRLHVDSLSASGPFGRLEAVGEIPDLSNVTVEAVAKGDFDVAAAERIFHLKTPFEGHASVDAAIRAGGPGGFWIGGRAAFAALSAGDFTFQNVSASVEAAPSGLRARIEQAEFDEGSVSGVLTLGPFDARVQTFELLAEAKSIGVEKFFSDIHLPGTGLASAADVTAALRWSGGEIERADGGGEITLLPKAGARAPAVAGSGGGAFAIRSGFIDFEPLKVLFPQTEFSLNGGFALGQWEPRLRFSIDSENLRIVDQIATNFSSAIQKAPAQPFGFEGRARIDGTLAGTWAMPAAAARVSAEDASFEKVRLGTVFSDLSVSDGAFSFHPMRAYDGEARLSLSGTARYAPKPGVALLDLTVEAYRFPVDRVLRYLDLDYPVTGKVSGTLPIAGDRSTLSGAGDLRLEDAVIGGQPVDRIAGRAVFTPGRIVLERARGEIGKAMFGIDGEYEMKTGAFRFRAAGDHLPIRRVAALASMTDSLDGDIDFHAQAEGTIDKPKLALSIKTSGLSLGGKPIPDADAPSIEISLDGGALSATADAPGRWKFEARGPVTGPEPELQFSVEIPDLAIVHPLFPEIPESLAGAISAAGSAVFRSRDGALLRAEASIHPLRIAARNTELELSAGDPIRVRFGDGLIRIGPARLAGNAGEVEFAASIGAAAPHSLSGTLNASVDSAEIAAFAWPEGAMSGTLGANLALAGTLAQPEARGTVSLEKGRIRSAETAYVLDDVSSALRLDGPSAYLESFHAHLGGGDLDVAGDVKLAGLSVSSYRLVAQAQNVTVRSIEDMRLKTNGDLTVTGAGGDATVRGDVTLLSGTYTKDFAPTIASLFSPSRAAEAAAGRASWQDHVALDVRVRSSAGLEVRNNLARLTASVDLVARGTLANPVFLGQVAVDEGGRVTFQDVRYDIQSASLNFGNTQRTEAVVDISATADVKGYAITVQAAGALGDKSRLQFQFSSDPPLTDEQVAALLLTGSVPEGTAAAGTRGDTTATSSILGSIAGLAFRPVTSKVQQLFGLDKFQIDPVLQSAPGSSGGAVITVGKNITKDLSVTYSYSAESNAQSIVLVEYQIDAGKVLQASKDENNVYSIDIKFRKRF